MSERCDACPLLFCDPMSPLCLETPEGKLVVTRELKQAEIVQRTEKQRRHCEMMRSHIDKENQAANARRQLAVINAFRASGFAKYRQGTNKYEHRNDRDLKGRSVDQIG